MTPRVLRVSSPENIHVQAHSDSSQQLSETLQVTLTVWDFPMKKTMVAKSQLTLSLENHFMNQTSVMVGDRPGGVATKGGRLWASSKSREGKTLEELPTGDTREHMQDLDMPSAPAVFCPFRNPKSPQSGLQEGP